MGGDQRHRHAGAEVYGYANEFDVDLNELGQISPEQFASLYPAPTNYLAKLTWDPTTAPYAQSNGLATVELAYFKTNGFVVSEGLGAPSCGEIYYRIFSGDLPVFITTDSILQAWHRSYISILEELEAVYLSRSLETILDGMASQIPAVWQQAGNGVLADSIRDADYYLAVARTLLAGTNRPTYLSQDARVAATIQAVNNLATASIDLFALIAKWISHNSKFRGHYEKSVQLSRYFQAHDVVRTDRHARRGQPGLVLPARVGHRYGVGRFAKQIRPIRHVEPIRSTAPGLRRLERLDDLRPARDLVTAANIRSLSDITSTNVLRQLQWDIVTGQKGFQNIRARLTSHPSARSGCNCPAPLQCRDKNSCWIAGCFPRSCMTASSGTNRAT